MEFNGNSSLTEVSFKKDYLSVVVKNPLREDAFEIDDDTKIELISEKFKEIIEILGLDLQMIVSKTHLIE